MRNCKKCGELKSLTDFPKNKQSRDGYELSCKACKRLLQKEWEVANQDRCKAARQRWASKHPERDKESKRKHYLQHKDKYYEYSREYAKANPGWKRAMTAKRRAALLQRTPPWADMAKIKEIYEEAHRRGLVVDHIIPLQGKIVSGLHVETNLQLLTASENSVKHNKFDPDNF